MKLFLKISLTLLFVLLLTATGVMGWYIYSNWGKINAKTNDTSTNTTTNTVTYSPLGTNLYKQIPVAERITQDTDEEKAMVKVVNDLYKARIAQNTTLSYTSLETALQNDIKKNSSTTGAMEENRKHGWKYISSTFSSYEIIANYFAINAETDYMSALVRVTTKDNKTQDELVNVSADQTGKEKVNNIEYLYNGADIIKYYNLLHLVIARADDGNTSVLFATSDFFSNCLTEVGNGQGCQQFKYDKNEITYMNNVSDYLYGTPVTLKDRVVTTEFTFGDGPFYTDEIVGTNVDTLKMVIQKAYATSFDIQLTDIDKSVSAICKAAKLTAAGNFDVVKNDNTVSIVSCSAGDILTTRRIFIVFNKKILKEISLSAAQKKNGDGEYATYDPTKDTTPSNIYPFKVLGVSYTVDINAGTVTQN